VALDGGESNQTSTHPGENRRVMNRMAEAGWREFGPGAILAHP
jgi:hypothetical protein